ncbi:MAG TPA: coproporphyrinogen-III oxidase family protein [Rhizomicrobium sp.]|nr:coproporphyrinogen-III oxidase family protein [Rhizomicrobium sp.]
MKFASGNEVKQRFSTEEMVQFDERDPCYTWLYPLALGDFDPHAILTPSRQPRFASNLTLYVHIPFCKFVCKMCPFTHEALGKKDLSRYVDALCEEIRFYGRLPGAAEKPVTSLYFGGGTASSLTPAQVDRILTTIRSYFTFAPGCPITLECHPRTVDGDYLAEVRGAGINRVSFGIQSFNAENIKSIKLHQIPEQSIAILETALATGFDCVAMDLMYRYPDQTVADLQQELDTALAIGVQSISTYALDTEVREMTNARARQKPVEIEREMYYYLHDRLHDEGFVHVAQPDYARPSLENRQLRDLWGAPQAENLSFGAGAFSENYHGSTWANIHDSNLYTTTIEEGFLPIAVGQEHSWDDAVSRYPALGVRCLQFETAPFREACGIALEDLFRAELDMLERKGWIVCADGKLTVTRTGKFFIDNISKTFFNLHNRGKSQIWGVQMEELRPHRLWRRDELLEG